MTIDTNIQKMREIVYLYDLLKKAQDTTEEVMAYIPTMHVNSHVLRVNEKMTSAFHSIYDALGELRSSKDVLRI